MSQSARLIQRGDALLEAGQLEDARRIWVSLLRADPQNEALWLRYVASFPDQAGQLAACDRWLEHSPHSWAARQAKSRLRATRPSPPAPSPPNRASGRRPWRWLAASGLLLCILALVMLVVVQWDAWQTESQTFFHQNQAFAIAKSSLEAKVSGLTNNYNTLAAEMDALHQAYNGLLTNHNTLVADYNSLTAAHTTLQTSFNQLNQEHETLRLNYNTTITELQFYQQTALLPPYTQIADQTIHLVFYKSDGSLKRWHIPFTWLETSVREGHDARHNIFNFWNTAMLTTSTGESVEVMDFSGYVDSAPFQAVVADMYYASPSPEAFVFEMWYLVSQLTSYAYEIQETPRLPLETLLSGGGDCEDTAILLASLLKAAPVAWDVQLFYMDANSPERPYTVNHVVVYLNTGEREYLIETTSDYEMQPWPTDTHGWLFTLN